jgi:hypothetical protein
MAISLYYGPPSLLYNNKPPLKFSPLSPLFFSASMWSGDKELVGLARRETAAYKRVFLESWSGNHFCSFFFFFFFSPRKL